MSLIDNVKEDVKIVAESVENYLKVDPEIERDPATITFQLSGQLSFNKDGAPYIDGTPLLDFLSKLEGEHITIAAGQKDIMQS